MKKTAILFLIILIVNITYAQELKIELEGEAIFDNSGLLISEAGEDFSSFLESDIPLFLSVIYIDSWNKMNNPHNKWNIQVSRSDINWHPDLTMEVRRSGNGYVPGRNRNPNIHDGDIFQAVTSTTSYFFRGKGEVVHIPLELQLKGLSVLMGAGTFETSITFTVYDEW